MIAWPKTYKKEYTTLGIALGSAHATMPNEYSRDTACSVSIPDNRLSPYLGDLVEGGMVIDKRPCTDREDFVKKACFGHSLRESLISYQVQKGYEAPVYCDNLDSLDSPHYLSLFLYCEYWKAMGAKIGVRRGSTIFWNDGSETKILPIDQARKVMQDPWTLPIE